MPHLDLITDQVQVHWVEVNCTLRSTRQSLAGAVQKWRAAFRPISCNIGASEFCMDRELTEQAEMARRQQAFVSGLSTGPQRSTLRQLRHTGLGEFVSVRHDTCKNAQNAPDTRGLHWRAKRRQARAYMDAQCWYHGAAGLIHHTPPADCLDVPGAAMLCTLTAYYENASRQCDPSTSVQCYEAVQAWCGAGRGRKADMPDKGTVMRPPPSEFPFRDWAPYYEADPVLQGEYAAATSGSAEHRCAGRHIGAR